jgi:D-3-phosphoglycerate dehydrogenase / 2-oxoglutarate reductase
MSDRVLPSVWFERPVPSELGPEIEALCTMCGPLDGDPFAGLADAEAVVAGVARYDAALMDRAPRLRVIARTGIGYDAVDVAEATRRGIVVCNTPDGPTVPTAEHAVTLMLMVAKNVKRAEGVLSDGTAAGYFARHRSIELDGKTLGLIGFGRIARRVARIAQGIGMRVIAFDPFLPATAFPSDVTAAVSLDALLGEADVVSVHVPLTDASRGFMGAAQFAAMKPGAVFVNSARGGLVDQAALLAALGCGHLFGAGLDVTTPEPLPPDHPLLGRDDIVVTPHVASATAEGRARMFRVAFEQVIDVLEGRRPPHLVDPSVWDRIAAAGTRP